MHETEAKRNIPHVHEAEAKTYATCLLHDHDLAIPERSCFKPFLFCLMETSLTFKVCFRATIRGALSWLAIGRSVSPVISLSFPVLVNV